MRKKNLIAIFLVVFTMMLSSFAFYTYQIIYTPNILIEAEDRLFAIPKGSTFDDVRNRLYDERYLNDAVSFSLLAKIKNYDQEVKAGLFLLKADMTTKSSYIQGVWKITRAS